MTTNHNPAVPRGNAAGRAVNKVRTAGNNTTGPELKADYAVSFVARRYGLAEPVARVVVMLAGLGALL